MGIDKKKIADKIVEAYYKYLRCAYAQEYNLPYQRNSDTEESELYLDYCDVRKTGLAIGLDYSELEDKAWKRLSKEVKRND